MCPSFLCSQTGGSLHTLNKMTVNEGMEDMWVSLLDKYRNETFLHF